MTTTIFPTPSYSIDLADGIESELDETVSSFWLSGNDVLLQLSSYVRTDGTQVGANERLNERLSKSELTAVRDRDLRCESCPDFACKGGLDREGIEWIYCYAVWADLAVFATISGTVASLANESALLGPLARACSRLTCRCSRRAGWQLRVDPGQS